MSISLFPHNQKAYESLLETLKTERRACIIHPTGTGKSFIGFKYCEDHPEQSVLWLSPSEYIFKTQCESLAATGTHMPKNITFMTYAKLSMLESEELDSLHPDVVILDEMHRAAAPTWEQPVQSLIAHKPEPVVIGLTATHIRYLDGQKDTTETFNLNIASEMNLGEAIALGILTPPRYVLSVYSYQDELEAYEKRIRRAKSKIVRDEANEYFEALRRAIEMAEGLDAIFAKHMKTGTGKYLVFCANIEHLDEMIEKAPEWFRKVDRAPHIYRAYSDDPGTSKAFAAFKADHSDHLKLLYCIDMLNEGVHVDDVDGVILLRPTISPIVYKQQIGRALSASKKKDAVIFDIVNNIDNLYSIGVLQQEIKLVVSYYRSLGEGAEIINDSFQIIDEVGNVRELFERLNDTLTASFDLMYSHAVDYFRENGNLEVPRRYKTPDGYSLGQWIFTQRKIYNGEQYGNLNDERIKKLEEIGMVWDGMRDLSWNRYFAEAEAYYQKHGDLRVLIDYVTESGLPLGRWIANQRIKRKSNIQTASLQQERIEALDRIGMVWDVPDYFWTQNYALLVEYHREHGNIQVPNGYITENGIRLGTWVARLRRRYNGSAKESPLSEEQIRQLNELGMVWDPFSQKWDEAFAHAEDYFNGHHDLNVPATYKCSDGFALGAWLERQRKSYADGKLQTERTKKLNSLGIVWEKTDPWEKRYELVSAYYAEHGDLCIPPDYKAEGIWLNKWLNEQRQIYIGNRPGKHLTENQIQRLNEIGMEWENRVHLRQKQMWDEQYAEAKRFFEENGHLNVPAGYRASSAKDLDAWIDRQRSAKVKAKLSDSQKKKLEAIGFQWEFDDPWEKGFEHAQKYYLEHGKLDAPGTYVCEDGYKLGKWLNNQKVNLKSTDRYRHLSDEQKARLDAIGMVWSCRQAAWDMGFVHAEEYLKQLNGMPWKTNYVSPDGYKTGEWLRNQVRAKQKGKLSPESEKLLKKIGLQFEKEPFKKNERKTRSSQNITQGLTP